MAVDMEETFIINDEDVVYASWLDFICWLKSSEKYKLLNAVGSAKDIYNMKETSIKNIVGEKACERIIEHRKKCVPAQVFEWIKEREIKYSYNKMSDFPRKLLKISDPPFGIFYKGKLPDLEVPAVAMIGARNCSEYGRYMAEKFAGEFASKGINIISGMAIGIDGISQRTAIKSGGKSFGILGCGVDVIYPMSNEKLYQNLIQNGAIISEYPPYQKAKPILFPVRNRLISALADVVLVVEAREKSGTLITVDMALEQGREVYVIPGRCTDELSVGCNKLMRQGAGAAVTPQDIIEDMGWEELLSQNMNKSDENKQQLMIDKNSLIGKMSDISQQICKVINIELVSQDDIVNKLREGGVNASVPYICQGLFELEINGIIVRMNGKYRLT